MAVEKVEINEPVEGEQMSLEEQLAQQEAENPNLVQQEEEEQPTQQEPSGQDNNNNNSNEEQELILGKFKSQEDLIKAYSELEKAQSSRQDKPSNEQGEEVSEVNVSSAIQNASDAFYENGELSEDNFQALEQSGIPREFVEAYVRGQEATMEAEVSSITNSIGGQENYDAMVQWASANLPEAEVDSYDDIVSTGTTDAATMAVKGMYARYLSENGGSSMNIAKGGTSGAAIQPFNSNAQVVEAMNDPRYQNDPAYRADVEKRISVSPNV